MSRTRKTKPISTAKMASQLVAIADTIGRSMHDATAEPTDNLTAATNDQHTEEVMAPKGDKPKNNKKSSACAGLPEGWVRFTLQVRSEYVDKLKDYAYTERIPMREAADRMFAEFLDNKTDLLQRPGK